MEPPKLAPGRPHLPIDYFFRSLAADQKERAVGIVLSGTGTDGTLGLKEIKASLGMAMAQQEASAAYAGMPHSAIATELVDYVLPAREMPGQLLTYVQASTSRAPARRAQRALPSSSQREALQKCSCCCATARGTTSPSTRRARSGAASSGA